ncbi:MULTISPECIES: hypothetical protein [Rhizobium]|uniref:Nucleoside 2-deoxyribosyltransferase n=1 Tax=Rhizobium rhododendri TaxID=2506430 RepID=A0ABY8IMF5_9HYPH|nr:MULTISPECIES: hypothetical protein [Rhizobium]MBZ5758364.1 hypothetical protein [Rhizobium sp. VS19-DR96]MBZ5764806.1 hypothetical protein [Rhizobium sp. VS19-DR129.2]MBZ5772349.1 hypothetical protein [Rhizobium sp. VS19-DRK62.2]MBZ5782964.1 hypothetical protein [Rhizobium sp. VS19-DR121]MBZ5800412.1 hypothetical protein [Rhizobium sp. VS19-DR181]
MNDIITLCGSARFERLFKAWNEALTLAGHTVFSVAVYPSDKSGVKQWYSDDQKADLDAAHLRKIAASDSIFVLNMYGYIGSSTLGEIEHAKRLGKKIYFLESWKAGNGVCDMHHEWLRDDMELDGLPRCSASPIDTMTSPHDPAIFSPWSSDLLGPGGAKRSSLVNLTKAAERPTAPSSEA